MTTALRATPETLSRVLLVALVLMAPVLLLPAAGSWVSLTMPWLALAAAVAATLYLPGRRYRVLIPWLIASIGVAWIGTPWSDPSALRHFGGIAFGMLVMTTVALACDSEDRLQLAVLLFCLGAAGVLVLGVMSTSVASGKLVSIVLSNPLRLGLPGLGESGLVNTNGLGGTAVMLAPAGFTLMLFPGLDVRHARLLKGVGGLLAVTALAVLLVSQSRSAWAAALLTLMTLGLRVGSWRVRAYALAAALLGIAAVTAGVWASYGDQFQSVVESTVRSGGHRTELWRAALAQLQDSPWLGIGIDQFRQLELPKPTRFVMDAPFWQSPHPHNTFLQVAVDLGPFGVVAYAALIGVLLRDAARAARGPRSLPACVAVGMGLSIVAVHWFGVADAIALGAKVGLFQWFAAGLVIAAWQLQSRPLPAA